MKINISSDPRCDEWLTVAQDDIVAADDYYDTKFYVIMRGGNQVEISKSAYNQVVAIIEARDKP